MTLKKSLISIVASTAIIATITGCSSNGTTAATTTTDPLISSSVTAVDGYIYNATAKAYYLAEDNASMVSIALTNTPTTLETNSSIVTLGSNSYALPSDTTDAVKSRIKFYEIATTASSTSGVTFTPAAYIEGDGVDGYDVNDTLLGATTILAPAFASIASPITNLLVLNNAATFGTTAAVPTSLVDLNSSVSTAIDANATALATKLGLGDVNLLTADPVATAATNPTYRLVNAMLKDASLADMGTILASTTPTTLAETLTIVSGLTDASGIALAAALAPLATAGEFTTDSVAEMNVEASVTNGVKTDTTAPVVTGKFPVDAIEIDDLTSGNFVAAGAKIDNTSLNIDLNMTNVDGNISNSTFNILISIVGNSINEAASDANNSGAIYASIPFELNSTNGELASSISAGTLVPFEAKNSSGSSIYSATDVNASALTLTGIIAHNTTTSLTIDAGTIITNLVARADNNVTGATGLDTFGISSAKVYIQDVDGTVIGVTTNGAGSKVLPSGNFASLTGAITATSAIKVLDLAKTDLRSTTTTSNNAPAITSFDAAANTANISHETAAGTVAADESGTTLLGNKLVVNEDAGDVEMVLNLVVNDEAGETNTTTAITGLPAWATLDDASIVGTANDATPDFNLTMDGNATVTGHDATMLTIKTTDEFGKTLATNDGNVTLMFNHTPVITATSSAADVNTTDNAIIVTNVDTVVDSDGQADLNASVTGGQEAVTIVGTTNYAGTYAASATPADVNTSADTQIDISAALAADGSVNWSLTATAAVGAEGTEGNVTVTYNVTDIYGASSADANITFDTNTTD